VSRVPAALAEVMRAKGVTTVSRADGWIIDEIGPLLSPRKRTASQTWDALSIHLRRCPMFDPTVETYVDRRGRERTIQAFRLKAAEPGKPVSLATGLPPRGISAG